MAEAEDDPFQLPVPEWHDHFLPGLDLDADRNLVGIRLSAAFDGSNDK